ncbi:MAG: hypothetical protein F2534_15020 [Actinobacteria bacterium]|nr:hypothetical protein [Actinomycetota bacterium]
MTSNWNNVELRSALDVRNSLRVQHLDLLFAAVETMLTEQELRDHADELERLAWERAEADLPRHLTLEQWAAYRHAQTESRAKQHARAANIAKSSGDPRAEQSADPESPPQLQRQPLPDSPRSLRRWIEAEQKIRSAGSLEVLVTQESAGWVAYVPGHMRSLPRPSASAAVDELLDVLSTYYSTAMAEPNRITVRHIDTSRPL